MKPSRDRGGVVTLRSRVLPSCASCLQIRHRPCKMDGGNWMCRVPYWEVFAARFLPWPCKSFSSAAQLEKKGIGLHGMHL